MSQHSFLDRIAVVLVRARNPQNIGAVARAMRDFGLCDLRIVNDYPMPLEGARSAVDASSILETAAARATVAEAVADCTLVVGTTAVGARRLDHPLFTLCEAAPILHAELGRPANDAAPSRIALLFGSEKTGLSNEELSHCNWLMTIPMHQPGESSETGGRHLSMNLGQAVAVCLYELVRDHGFDGPPVPHPLPATPEEHAPGMAAERERLAALLSEVLDASEYRRHHPANSGIDDLRKLVLRLHLTSADIAVWMGMLRQILWKLRH
jgi:tRNA/rRNA methyltransferase